MKIGVMGAGVAGLSTGKLLLNAGHSVTIYAEHFSPNTTSDVAPAI